MRARLALLASGVICEIREVKLSAKPPEMLAASPKGTVPVLVLPDGHVIDQSLEIMHWALGCNDPEGWLEGQDTALIAANDGPFKHHLDRYKYPERHSCDPAEHRAAGLAMLHELETRLGTQANLCGDTRGLTDMAIFPFIRQFAATDTAWFEAQLLRNLHRWLARHMASPLFEAAMIRLAPWQAGDAAKLFAALPLGANTP
jgi:glutathione S-transferase